MLTSRPLTSETRVCIGCQQSLPVTDFHWRNKARGLRNSRCIPCRRARRIASDEFEKRKPYNDQWRAENVEHTSAYSRRWAAENKDKILAYKRSAQSRERSRAWRLSSAFGLTIEDYEAILAHQGGVCAICGRKQADLSTSRRLHVDHSHKSGLVRGLVCWFCNTAIGKFRDDPDLLEKASKYLRSPPATEALGKETFGRKGPSQKKRRKKRKKS